MRVTLVGPGRAGAALALAARSAGHEIVDVSARRPGAAEAAIELLGQGTATSLGEELAATDLIVVATSDDAIAEAAAAVAPGAPRGTVAVHLSGLAGLGVLAPFLDAGSAVGSFHPLQTLPSPERGAAMLPGSWIAVTTRDARAEGLLREFARSLGCTPFDLPEEAKPLYHAAASAASNLPVGVLAMAADLFEAAGVPFEAAGPLVKASVANVVELGPRSALTGPIARGDRGTVEAQLRAVSGHAPQWADTYRRLAGILAGLSGRRDEFAELLGEEGP